MNSDNTPASYLILGASSSIGQQLALSLVEDSRTEGARVVLLTRSPQSLDERLLQHTRVSVREGDATSFAEVDTTVEQVNAECGGIIGLVNCAGGILLKPAHLTSFEEFSQLCTVNLNSAFATVRAAGKHLRNANVVLFSSAATRLGLANHEAIVATKAGIEALVRSAAATYAHKNIRFNCIAPGLTATAMTKRITENPQALEYSISMHALGRIGQPEEVALAAMHLLCAEQQWITGQTLAVDGGLSSVRTKGH